MTFPVFTITGNPVFDYFFTLVFMMGCISIGPTLLFRLFRS